jgi:hypothetical protein
MPTKVLDSQADRNGLQSVFTFGGGSDTVFANDDRGSPFGYIINTGGGDDTIFGSDYAGAGASVVDPRTDSGDVLVGGDGSDNIFGSAGDDTIYGGHQDGSLDASKGQSPAPQNLLVGDGERMADGSISARVTFVSGNTFTGGNDTLYGGNGATNNSMFGDATIVQTQAGHVFNGGDDKLVAGDGAFNVMTGDATSITGVGTVNGGDDVLISGTGNDQMFGDWSSAGGFTGTAVGGADTFVFGLDNGFDSIGDFEQGKDTIDLEATGLIWDDLDTNGNDVLDDGDTYVTVSSGGTTINLGGAIADDPFAFGDQIVISGVTGLLETDFDFTTVLIA